MDRATEAEDPSRSAPRGRLAVAEQERPEEFADDVDDNDD